MERISKSMCKNILAVIGVSGLLASCLFSITWGMSDKREDELLEVRKIFQSVISLDLLEYKIPTVVEVPIVLAPESTRTIAVFADGDSQPEAYQLMQLIDRETTSFRVRDAVQGEVPLLSDGKFEAYQEYAVPDIGMDELSFGEEASLGRGNQVVLDIDLEASVLVESFSLHLGKNIALPQKVQVSSGQGASEKILLQYTRLQGRTIQFPPTRDTHFRILLEHVQPLRITEITVNGVGEISTHPRYAVRFLAYPDKRYKVYFNADQAMTIPTKEVPHLYGDDTVTLVSESQINTLYQKADGDQDGIPDEKDNCVSVANENQEDIDGNGKGDVCEDFDRDGVQNGIDNCPLAPNRLQKDGDGDGIGDTCDTQENRLFQRWVWLPWVAIVFVGVVVVVLLVSILRKIPDMQSKE